MFRKLLALMGRQTPAGHTSSQPPGHAVPSGGPLTPWQAQQLARNTEWMRDYWSGRALAWMPHGTDGGDGPALPEVDPHWPVLRHLCRWSRLQYDTAPQAVIDQAVAGILGISWTHAALMRLGIRNARPIWPDTVIERDGPYPWTFPEIHAFWSRLDVLPRQELDRIAATATRECEALETDWRDVHRIVLAHYADYHLVLERAVGAILHPCAAAHIGQLQQAKTRATFEIMASRVAGEHAACRYLALFGISAPADLLTPQPQDAGHQKEALE